METNLVIEHLKIYAYHGFYEEERKIGHWFEVDINIMMDQAVCSIDDLTGTINYEVLYNIITEEMSITRHTLEYVGNNIINRLQGIKLIKKITLRIMKLKPFKMEGVERVGICLEINNAKNY